MKPQHYLQPPRQQVAGGVQISRDLARIAKTANIPTSTWRCLRRRREQGERIRRCERTGSLDTSVRRYAKVGKIQSLLNQFIKWALQYCKQAVSKMPEVILGRTGATQSAPRATLARIEAGSILEIFAGVRRVTSAFRNGSWV